MRRLVAIALGLWLLLGLAASAEANGHPFKVVLTYLPEVSNWGPKGATGIAELVPVEGEVRVTTLGLPRLNGEAYDVWLVNSKTNQVLELGQLNSDDQGEARLERVLPEAIPDLKWDLLLLTVEKAGSPPAAPGGRKAIAGYIEDHSGTGQAPQQLPKTGGDTTGPGPQELPRTGGNAAVATPPGQGGLNGGLMDAARQAGPPLAVGILIGGAGMAAYAARGRRLSKEGPAKAGRAQERRR